MKSKNNIAVLLLAAGRSSRMGSPKQLAVVKGIPLLQRIISNILSEQYDVFIVTGSYRDEIRRLINLEGVIEIVNPHWEEGIGSSIRVGIKEIKSISNYDRIIVCMGDQVFLTSSILINIIETSNAFRDHIVVSNYGDITGPPVLFPEKHFDELVQLKGDQGARSVIKRQVQKIKEVPFAGGSMDIDTQDDLKNLKI